MNPVRKKRLLIVLFILAGVGLATALLLTALGENINHFYTPSQVVAGEAPVNTHIRVGGLVVPGSVNRNEGLKVVFDLTDKSQQIRVEYEGILPDLFREGQGIIAIGQLDERGIVIADEVLAKHDETYMPPEVKAALEAAGHPVDETP